jgi:hypothetical protein
MKQAAKIVWAENKLGSTAEFQIYFKVLSLKLKVLNWI